MPGMSVMIKPASGACNLRCRYCFYADEMARRETASFGTMSEETLERVLSRLLEAAEGECSILFQGGEPTLAGLPFYRRVVELERRYGRAGLHIHNSIQTNGYTLDGAWASFFAEHGFLVGLSVDGRKDLHDLYRVDGAGKGSFRRAMEAARLLERHGVEFSVLTVVTAQLARHAEAVYRFYRKNGFLRQQYIPCLDPLEGVRGGQDYSLTPERYAAFLKALFDCWYADLENGFHVAVRYFDNLLCILRGSAAEDCGLTGHCSPHYVVEADGGVYPCDFYVLDEWRLGSLRTDTLDEIDGARRRSGFLEGSLPVPQVCGDCPWYGLCRNGCRRDRVPDAADGGALNYYCGAYQDFFPYAVPRLRRVAVML